MEKKRLQEIPGIVPSIFEMPRGCRFHPRCHRMMDICRLEEPPMVEMGQRRRVLCWLWA
jgi:oligopeptide/dipeptide ABC transporter ATP-binding protein